MNPELKKRIASIYTIFLIITTGFAGLLVFDGVVDYGGLDVAAAKTIIVDKGGGGNYTMIQAAINAANVGDTIYVWAGTYYEYIIMNKTVTLIGNGTLNTTINGGGSGNVVHITADWVNITGFTIKNSGSSIFNSGIKFSNVKNCCIYNNNVSDNGRMGICINFSSTNRILNNTCNSNNDYGIYLLSSPSNIIKNNYCFNNTLDAIGLQSSSNNIINNNSFSYNRFGIELVSSSSNIISDNSILHNSHGIDLEYSSSNIIINNTCSFNTWSGIDLEHSPNNFINNNSCHLNTIVGIDLYYSSNNNITNNSFNLNKYGIILEYSSSNIINKDFCNSNSWDGIRLDYSSGNNIYNNSFISNSQNGICLLFTSNSNIIFNNNCTNNQDGIYISKSTNNIVTNNYINSNSLNGITLSSSSSNTISNNSCDSNDYEGIRLFSYSNSNIITNNDCSNHRKSICLDSSFNNKLINNSVSFNHEAGYFILNSDNNSLNNNSGLFDNVGIFLNNSNNNNIITGNISSINHSIQLVNSKNNIIDNFTISSEHTLTSLNRDAFSLYKSDYNKLSNITVITADNGIVFTESKNNTLKDSSINIGNWAAGIKLTKCSNGTIKNCAIHRNMYGLRLFSIDNCTISNCNLSGNSNGLWIVGSDDNQFINNSISNNKYDGIKLWASDRNIFKRNAINFNFDDGFEIDRSNQNKIYHNNIEYNIKHINIIGISSNSFYFNKEGNYWTGYSGWDTDGDLIGDTNTPYNGDLYPFIKRDGWLYPGGFPTLDDLGNFNNDGNYTLSWSTVTRTRSYRLEEDTVSNFQTPTILYNGANTQFQIFNRQEDTYYYRIKAHGEKYESTWSGTESITVDYSPGPPTNLEPIEISDTWVTLKWAAPPDQDICGYHIFISYSSSGPYNQHQTTTNSQTMCSVYNLEQETTYFFKVCAYDGVSTNSTFSNFVEVTTLDLTAPSQPGWWFAEALNDHEIKLHWHANPETDIFGYHIFMNETGEDKYGQYTLMKSIYSTITTYIVSDLMEHTLYHFKLMAFDEVPNNSSFSDVLSVSTLDLTPPAIPTGLKVSNPTNHSLTISWNKNSDIDLAGYNLYRGLELDETFNLVNNDLITNLKYIDMALSDGVRYYYKLKAIDDANLASDFSEIVSGTTKHDPYHPQINNSIEDFEIPEDTYDDSINLYQVFKDINNDPLIFRCTGQIFIDVTIHQENGTVILSPKTNWNGVNVLKFYASDGISGEIYDTVIITVTPVNDPPFNAEINYPYEPVEILETEDINLEGQAEDPDIDYGDFLSYIWFSNISGKIGIGKELNNVMLSPGEHLITLTVMDKEGEITEAFINISVLKEPRPNNDKDNDNLPDDWEIENGLKEYDDDSKEDPDNDGLTNIEEYILGTNPKLKDTDGDKLSDGDEINIYNTNATNKDTDGDGHKDGEDAYPLDETKWEKKAVKDEETDSSWLIIATTIIVIVIIMILLFVLKSRIGKKMKEEETEQDELDQKTTPSTPKTPLTPKTPSTPETPSTPPTLIPRSSTPSTHPPHKLPYPHTPKLPHP